MKYSFLRPWLCLALFPTCLLASACAADRATKDAKSAQTEPAPVLPLQSLRLYDVGIGYFERAGTLSAARTQLPVPAAHVDDALKTLIILGDGGKAQVSAVEFSSVLSDSLARVLAGIPVGTGEPIRYVDVLRSFRGLRVSIELKPSLTERQPVALVGTLLEVAELQDVAQAPAESDNVAGQEVSGAETFQLTVLESSGAVRRITTAQVLSLRPQDPGVAQRLDTAATTLAKRSAQLPRGLELTLKADAKLRIGYMAETPVWRPTYRLVLPQHGADSVLQGWALLHNDTDEAWRELRIELVNGRPDSFLFPLAAPRYARRQLAEPSETLSTAPQLSRVTADQMWGDYVEPDPEEGGGLGLSGMGEGGGGRGEGIGLGSIGTLGHGVVTRSGDYTTGSGSISIGNLASLAPAKSDEGLTLFAYDLGKRVSVRAHGSALVPFLAEGIRAERITWFGNRNDEARSATLLWNSTNKTLPAGVLSVYEVNGFVGETALDRLKPTERQLLRFGFDLDVNLKVEPVSEREVTRQIEFRDGALVRHYVRESSVRYSVSNRSGLPRQVHVVLGIRDNAVVKGADSLDYHEGQGGASAVFNVPARTARNTELAIAEGLERVVSLAAVDSALLQSLATDNAVPQLQRQIVQTALVELAPLEALRKQRLELETQREQLEERQERLHKHQRQMEAAEGAQTELVTRILKLEDELTALQNVEQATSQRLRTAEVALEKVLKQLEANAKATPAPAQAAP